MLLICEKLHESLSGYHRIVANAKTFVMMTEFFPQYESPEEELLKLETGEFSDTLANMF